MTDLVSFDAWARLMGDSPTARTEWAAVVAAWSEACDLPHEGRQCAVGDALRF